MDEITLGNLVTMTASFTVSDVATDPTVVTLRYRRRGAAETTVIYTSGSIITKTAVGQYTALIDPDSTGQWRYRWEGTAPAKGASEGAFTVISDYIVG